jgi:putative NADH-flavin reductase
MPICGSLRRPDCGMRRAGVKRLLVVGGAGSLEVAPGKSLMDTDGFPAAFKAEAKAGARSLERLTTEPDLDWAFLSPSADFVPRERTGRQQPELAWMTIRRPSVASTGPLQ